MAIKMITTGTAIAAAAALAACGPAMPDLARDTFPDAQAQVRRRLDEIWDSANKKDLDRLGSYHLYGPKFTEFKDGAPRGDAASGEQGERAFFTIASDVRVDMKDLAVNVFGDVAIATFNGDYRATLDGNPIAMQAGTTMVLVRAGGDWKIVHEHISALAPPAP